MYQSFYRDFMQAAFLAAESQQVIALRMFKMASGGTASAREAQLMFSEKMLAAGEAAMSAAAGKPARSIVRAYRSKVRANRRRLTR